jgi:hypothetical protein
MLQIPSALVPWQSRWDCFRLPLLNGTVHLDVNNVANPKQNVSHEARVALDLKFRDVLVLLKVGRQSDHTLLPEIPREGISRTGAETCCVTHLA